MPMGLDQVWEPLEGLSPGDKLVTLTTPSRTDLALLQSRPNHLQGQRGRSEDCALGPANQNIRDLFPDRDPRSAAGETGRAHVRGPARWARGWPSRTPSRVQQREAEQDWTTGPAAPSPDPSASPARGPSPARVPPNRSECTAAPQFPGVPRLAGPRQASFTFAAK